MGTAYEMTSLYEDGEFKDVDDDDDEEEDCERATGVLVRGVKTSELGG